MGQKKGQITLFVLVGLLILLLVALFLVVNMQATEEKIQEEKDDLAEVDSVKDPVQQYVEACLKSVTEEGLLTIGLQGGYYNVPANNFSTIYGDIPYYYDKGDISLVPSLNEITTNFADFLSDNLNYCLNDFEYFESQGYDIETGDRDFYVGVTSSGLNIILNYPVKLVSETETKELSEFSLEYDIRLQDIYSVVNTLMTTVMADPYAIYYSLLLELNVEHNIQIDTFSDGNETVVYVIQDPESLIQDVPFVFLFATKVSTENNVPMINTEIIEAKVGEDVSLYIDVFDREGDQLYYYSEEVDIHPYSGLIEFVPDTVGEYVFTIYVDDGIEEVSQDITIKVGE